MTNHDAEKLETESPIAPPADGPTNNLGRQMIGALIGAAVAYLLVTAARQLGWASGAMVRYLLWGGVIGGLIGASDTLTQAGKRLTHRDEDWLNLLVSLVGMVVVFGLLFGLVLGLSYVLRLFLPK